jgi:hypothetical protein
MSSFGLTLAGFVPKKQSQVVSEIQAALRGTFGANSNLDERALFGQLTGIFAEREALLWELAEAIYASQYPNGAEGTAVDNILALSNLRRLGATASKTNPNPAAQSNGITLRGLVLKGTPGTVVNAGSSILSNTVPPLTFTLDADVTIGPAANASQSILYSNTPTQGNYTLQLLSYLAGNALLSGTVNWQALPAADQLQIGAGIIGGSIYLMIDNNLMGPFATGTSAATIQAAIAAIGALYSGTVVTGSFGPPGFNITTPGFHPFIRANGKKVGFSGALTTGAFILQIGSTLTASIPAASSASQVEAAIHAADPSFTGIRVALNTTTPSAPFFALNWVNMTPVAVTVPTNTTGLTATVSDLNSTFISGPSPGSVTVVDSVQTVLNNLYDGARRPFSDIGITGSVGTMVAVFGANAALAGESSSGAQPQPIMGVANNTMQAGAAITSVSIAQNAEGAVARGIGTATCSVTGPNAVLAGQLTTIGSPVSGWASVTNELDVLKGSNTETDLAALARRSTLLAAQASGPLQSIIERVQKVTGVTNVSGFANVTDAALQSLTFASVPGSGVFQLFMPIAGATANITASTATAGSIQTAINALAGMSSVLVSGNMTYGFAIDFNGAYGGQAQPLIGVVGNTTGVVATVAFTRPPKSFEIIVLGGSNADVAKAIYAAMPAGVQSYGSPGAVTTMTSTSGNAAVTVAAATGILPGMAAFGFGVPPGATVLTIAGVTVTLSSPATANVSGGAVRFDNTTQIIDDFGNLASINFTRPTPVLVYVSLVLTTDIYRTPGDPTSGVNPASLFLPSSMAQMQADIVAAGALVAPGGVIIGKGSNGLVGAFNEVPGVINYTLNFGLAPSPSSNSPIQLLPSQAPSFQTALVAVSYT